MQDTEFNFINDDFDVASAVQDVIDNRFDIHSPLPERPEYLLEYNGKGILAESSMMLLSGPSKSRKTALVGFIEAACIRSDGFYKGFKSKIKGPIIYADNEQTEIENTLIKRKVFKMAGLKDNNENYYSLKLGSYSYSERYMIIKSLIEDYYGSIGLLILDGIADLQEDTNDSRESRFLTVKVQQWCHQKKFPAIGVLHTNETNDRATGFSGKFWKQKCSYHIQMSVPIEGGPSLAKAKHVRLGEYIDPIAISHDAEGLPIITNNTGFIEADDDIDSSYSDDYTESESKVLVDKIMKENLDTRKKSSILEQVKKNFS